MLKPSPHLLLTATLRNPNIGYMGKVIVVIACILIVLTIAAGFVMPATSDFLGAILIFDIILLGIGVLIIARETRPAHY